MSAVAILLLTVGYAMAVAAAYQAGRGKWGTFAYMTLLICAGLVFSSGVLVVAYS